MLGRYQREGDELTMEFQIGRRLVWVHSRESAPDSEIVARADLMLPAIWAALPDAIKIAEDHCRILLPEFWDVFDSTIRGGHPMDIWGIRLMLDDGMSLYDVSINWDFDFTTPTFKKDDFSEEEPIYLPILDDNHHVMVERAEAGALRIRG